MLIIISDSDDELEDLIIKDDLSGFTIKLPVVVVKYSDGKLLKTFLMK